MIPLISMAVATFQAPSFHEVTIYNQGFALVKESRTLDLKQGRQTVAIADVAARIEPSSVGFRSLTDPTSISVLEQNYQFDLISPLAILNKSVGQPIRFIRTVGGQRDVLDGTLLNAPTAIVPNENGGSQQTYNGMVIRTDDGRIVLNPSGEIEVKTVPEGLISVPTLLWDLESTKAGPNKVELSYLTQGITWNADYVLTLNQNSTDADLQGWVTVNNQCGATFENATMKLLAGEVQRPQQNLFGRAAGGAPMEMAKADAGFQEESFFEYHLYTLQRPATIRNREIKQLSLLEGHGIKTEKKLVLDAYQTLGRYYPSEGEIGTGDLKPQVRIEFTNSKENGLGMPLPKGNVKVYQRDSKGSVQMLGEDQIDHTPKDEHLSLVVGRSFDVVATRTRTNFRRINSNSVEETFKIEIRNRKDSREKVLVYERHYGDWKITKTSMDWTKKDSATAQYVVELNPNETKTIEYTVVTRW